MKPSKLRERDEAMIDLETLGTDIGAPILQIGCCVFNQSEGIKKKIELHVNLQSEIDNKTVSADTLAWWMSQGDEARQLFAECNNSTMDLQLVLAHLKNFLCAHRVGRVWANGPTFDVTMLQEAAKKADMLDMWLYNAPRCTRTIFDLGAELEVLHPINTKKHDALADAVHQAESVIRIRERIRDNAKRAAQ